MTDFGSNDVRTDFTSGAADRHYGSLFTAAEDLDLTEMHCLVRGTGHFRLNVYTNMPGDTLAGATRLGGTAEISHAQAGFADGTAALIVTVSIVAAEKYWLTWHCKEDSALDFGETWDSGHGGVHNGNHTGGDSYADGSAVTFPAVTTSGERTFSIWAVGATPEPEPDPGPSAAWTQTVIPEQTIVLNGVTHVVNPAVYTAERLGPTALAVHRSARSLVALTALTDAYDDAL